MQAKAKLQGDHHSLSLLRLLRDELSLPACLFPTSLGGGIGVFGGAGGFPPPVQGRRGLPLALPINSRTVEGVCWKTENYPVSLQAHRMLVSCQCAGAMFWPDKF